MSKNIPRRSVRLSKPRIPPLKGAEFASVMEKLTDKSEWERVVQVFVEQEKKSSGGPVLNFWATLARQR